MALVLQLVPGEDFYVGGERYVLKEIVSDTAFTIERARDGKRFHILDDKAILIEADVYASAGTRGQATSARLCIEAPRSVRILRGELYRQAQSQISR